MICLCFYRPGEIQPPPAISQCLQLFAGIGFGDRNLSYDAL